MKTATRTAYAKRIERVAEYLIDHLDDDLDLHRLAEEAHLSPYHFHRVYRGLIGETVVDTLRRLRLHRAAVKLISSDIAVTTLALEAHFQSVQAFSRAFHRAYGTSPSDYRARQFRQSCPSSPGHLFYFNKEQLMNSVTIENVPPCDVVAIAHGGDYMDIGNKFEKLMIWAASLGVNLETARSFGIYYDDPSVVAKDDLRSHACIEMPKGMSLPNGYEYLRTPGGKCAVLIHVGPYSDLEKSYQWFYGEWLPQSGEEPGEQSVFEEYLNDPRQVPPAELRTAIRMPLKG